DTGWRGRRKGMSAEPWPRQRGPPRDGSAVARTRRGAGRLRHRCPTDPTAARGFPPPGHTGPRPWPCGRESAPGARTPGGPGAIRCPRKGSARPAPAPARSAARSRARSGTLCPPSYAWGGRNVLTGGAHAENPAAHLDETADDQPVEEDE